MKAILIGLVLVVLLIPTTSGVIDYYYNCSGNIQYKTAYVNLSGSNEYVIQNKTCDLGCNTVTNRCVESNLPMEMYLPISLIMILSAFVFAYLGTQMKEHGSLQFLFLIFCLYMITLSISNIMQFNVQTQNMAQDIVTSGYLVGIYAIFLTLLYFFLKLLYGVLISAFGHAKRA